MSKTALLAEFVAALLLVSISGFVLTGQIERLGARLGFTPGLLGLAVAFGADSPEIAAAVSALLHGRGDIGAGVVLGSNIFNVAAILGVAALVASNGVQIGRAGLIVNGGTALIIALLAGALALGWIPPAVALGLFGVVFLPYVLVSSLHKTQLRRAPLPAPLLEFLGKATVEVEQDTRLDESAKRGRLLDFLSVVPTLAAIVGGSFIMVNRAVIIADRWKLPGSVVGTLGLASLTGIPNLIAALHLARRGRGTAVMSEALNSNSLNIIFGLGVPSLLLGVTRPSAIGLVAVFWLPAATLLAILLAGLPGGLKGKGGTALLVSYGAFATTVVLLRGR